MRPCTRTPVPVARTVPPANESLLVISNFTDQEQERDFAVLAEAREAGARVELVSSNYKDDAGSTLRPYEAKVYHIVR